MFIPSHHCQTFPVWTPLTGIWYFRKQAEVIITPKTVWTPLTGIWYFRGFIYCSLRVGSFVWTPLTGIWYFRRMGKDIIERKLSCLNSTYWNLVFQGKCVSVAMLWARMFELHLLESGISGPNGRVEVLSYQGLNSTYWNLVFQARRTHSLVKYLQFELHLLESGISGTRARSFRRHKHVWTPLTGIWYFRVFPPLPALRTRMFELHLLESGISGIRASSNLMPSSRVWTPLTGIWYFRNHRTSEAIRLHFKFELHLLESGISGW